MSQEAEKVKKLIAFKKRLGKRVEELECERKELQLMLEAVDFVLLEKGFKRAEIVEASTNAGILPVREEVLTQPSRPKKEYENVIPLKTVKGELLANIYVNQDSLRVVLSEDKNLNVNTPPFKQFLVERVLAKMQEKDSELARTGELEPNKIFSYNIVEEEDTIRELEIENFSKNRFRELKSSIRWTLEKMYEKTQSQI